MFPSRTAVLGAAVEDHTAALHREELQCVARAVAKRRAEFSTGRVLAAQALAMLDVAGQPLLKGANNEPLWPDGVVGSITHNSLLCVVAVAHEDVCTGIGIDVEHDDADVSSLAHLILRDDEIADQDVDKRQLDDCVRYAFSAKESVFKAIFRHVGRFVDFREVSVAFDAAGRRFHARAPEDEALNRLISVGEGGCVYADGLLATGFYLANS